MRRERVQEFINPATYHHQGRMKWLYYLERYIFIIFLTPKKKKPETLLYEAPLVVKNVIFIFFFPRMKIKK